MSAKPFTDAEIDAIRAHPFDKERIWLATVDALQSRLAAAEAEAERARGALVEVRRMIESDAYRASITARIDAHLASRPEGEVAP